MRTEATFHFPPTRQHQKSSSRKIFFRPVNQRVKNLHPLLFKDFSTVPGAATLVLLIFSVGCTRVSPCHRQVTERIGTLKDSEEMRIQSSETCCVKKDRACWLISKHGSIESVEGWSTPLGLNSSRRVEERQFQDSGRHKSLLCSTRNNRTALDDFRIRLLQRHNKKAINPIPEFLEEIMILCT